MTTAPIYKLTAVLPLVLLVGCGSDSAAPRLAADLQPSFSITSAEWSTPVNVGAPVNSAAGEMNATLSPDELSLYFTSDRAGGHGGTDIWISQRECVGCPWQSPVNAGAPLNSSNADAGPRFSNDGHLLFFQSDRPGGVGLGDIYVTRRSNPNDDFAWETPVLLGGDVNTATGNEQAADYLQSAEDGTDNLYFNRQTAAIPPDIYYAPVSRNGETRGPAVYVTQLNNATAVDQHVTIRKDGRELFFSSNRTAGLFDIWTSTRRSVHEIWSSPVAVAALNTAANDQQPTLSHDGRTLIFASNRTGGSGGNDLWISTRSPSDH